MREWSVTIEWLPSIEVTEDLAFAMAEVGGALGMGNRLDTTVTVEAWDPAEAGALGIKTVTNVIPGEVVALEVLTTEEADRRFDAPAFPELVGVTEIAGLLGISRQRASALSKSAAFPGPIAEIASGPIWRRGDLSRFEESWERKSGRPRKPGRFLIQHLDMSASQNGANWTRYTETLDEALAVADEAYDPANTLVRQEIIERFDDTTTEWRFRGSGHIEWSRPTRRHEANLARVYKQEEVR